MHANHCHRVNFVRCGGRAGSFLRNSKLKQPPKIVEPSLSSGSPENAHFFVETFNGSGQGTLKKRLEESDAMILCAQEI